MDAALALTGGDFTGGDFRPPRAPEMARFRTGVDRTGDGAVFTGTGALVIFNAAEAFRTGTGFWFMSCSTNCLSSDDTVVAVDFEAGSNVVFSFLW